MSTSRTAARVRYSSALGTASAPRVLPIPFQQSGVTGALHFGIAVGDRDDAVSVEHALVRSGQLANDLAYEGLVWMRRGADDRDAPRVQLDHKQRVGGDQATDSSRPPL